MIGFVCSNPRCRKSKSFDDDFAVDGVPIREWIASRRGLCSECFKIVEDSMNEPPPTPPARAALPFVPPSHLARSSDPHTSKRSACGRFGSHRRRILDAIAASSDGCTFAEAAVAAGLKESQTCKRISDLLNAELIECVLDERGDPLTRKLPSGDDGRVYQLSAVGRALLAVAR